MIEIKQSDNFFLKLFKSSQTGFGMDLSTYRQCVMKKKIDELRNILPPEFSALYDKNFPKLKQELNSVVVYKEVYEVLENLKKDYKIFLVSNLASPYKEPFFSNNLDKHFEKMIFSC